MPNNIRSFTYVSLISGLPPGLYPNQQNVNRMAYNEGMHFVVVQNTNPSNYDKTLLCFAPFDTTILTQYDVS